MLTFRPKFIRALWYTLQQSNAGFSSPLNLITKGIQIGESICLTQNLCVNLCIQITLFV